MTTVVFKIPGPPFAKQRPRFSRVSGRTFTPTETVKFEAIVRDIALQHMAVPLVGPVSVSVDAIFEPPKSWSAKKRAANIGKPHIQKPDIDNCVKAIFDGLNRVAFVDDSQIAEQSARKRWGDQACTIVTIECI